MFFPKATWGSCGITLATCGLTRPIDVSGLHGSDLPEGRFGPVSGSPTIRPEIQTTLPGTHFVAILREVTLRQVARNREQTGVSQHALDDFRAAPGHSRPHDDWDLHLDLHHGLHGSQLEMTR